MTESCDHLEREGLLARELGTFDPHVATCADCQAGLARLTFLDDIARMPAWSPAPAGWQARVWAAIDVEEAAAAAPARPSVSVWRRWTAALRRRPAWLAVPVLVAAAAIALLVALPRRDAPSFALDVEVHPAPGVVHRTLAGVVGDRVTAKASGADAVWVYLIDGALVARCPGSGGDDTCRVSSHGVALTFTLTVAARHRIVAVSGAGDLSPTGDFDRDIRAAHARGARVQVQTVAVAPGS